MSAANENVPNFVKAAGNACFEVSFTPQVADTHMISVKFNGEMVPGNTDKSCFKNSNVRVMYQGLRQQTQ